MVSQLTDKQVRGYVIHYDLRSENRNDLKGLEIFYEDVEVELDNPDGTKTKRIVRVEAGSRLKEETPEERAKRIAVLKRVRNTRWHVTHLLAMLGLKVSDSVIVITGKKSKKVIDDTIRKAKEAYRKLNEDLKKEGYKPLRDVLINDLALEERSYVTYLDIAEKRLAEHIESILARVVKDLPTVRMIAKDRKKAKKRFENQLSRLRVMERTAQELGVKVPSKYSLLINMLHKATQEL